MKLLSETKCRYMLIVVTILVLGMLAGAETSLWSVQRLRVAELEASCRTTEKELQEATLYVRRHPDPEKSLGDLKGQVGLLNLMMPPQADLAAFAGYLEQAAVASGVRLDALRPGAPTIKNGILAAPLEMALQGSYFSILMFLRKLEESPRQLTVSHFHIKAQQGMLETRMKLMVYSLAAGEYKK